MRKMYVSLLVVTLFFLCGCGSSIDHSAQTVIDDILDQTANVVQSTDEDVLFVKNGHPNNYPNIKYGDAFEYYFGDPTWKSFKGTQEGPDEDGDGKEDYTVDDVDVVEFTGFCLYKDVKVKALIQFVLDKEEGTFSAEYLSFNEVPQNLLMLYGLLDNVFEDYQSSQSKSENRDSEVLQAEEEPEIESSTNDVNAEDLKESIMVYYAIYYGMNSLDAEIDHEDNESLTIRIFDPNANTTSNTLGYYEYDKKTGKWKDSVTGEVLDFGDASAAHNERLENNNHVDETIPEFYGYVNAPDGYVNLREGPGTSYNVICPINNGEAVELYGEEAEAANGKKWIRIAYYSGDRWNDGWVIASQIDY